MSESFDKYKIDACRLGLPDLKLSKVLSASEKGSVSNTIIAFGKIADRFDVVAKISFFHRNDARDNSIAVERALYEQVVPRMHKETASLMTFVGVYECTDFQRFLKLQLEEAAQGKLLKQQVEAVRTIVREMQFMESKGLGAAFDFRRPYFLVTERSTGRPLSEWYEEMTKMSEQERVVFIKDVLAQVTHALTVFRKFGFMHNDLHDGNVLVRKLSQPVELSLDFVNRRGAPVRIQRTMRYAAQIFDFDHSSKVPTKHDSRTFRNTMLDVGGYCKAFGECNEFIENKDWFNLLYFMWINQGSDYFKNLLPQQLAVLPPSNPALKSASQSRGYLSWPGHPCVCDDVQCQRCVTRHDLLRNMMSPEDWLESSLATSMVVEETRPQTEHRSSVDSPSAIMQDV